MRPLCARGHGGPLRARACGPSARAGMGGLCAREHAAPLRARDAGPLRARACGPSACSCANCVASAIGRCGAQASRAGKKEADWSGPTLGATGAMATRSSADGTPPSSWQLCVDGRPPRSPSGLGSGPTATSLTHVPISLSISICPCVPSVSAKSCVYWLAWCSSSCLPHTLCRSDRPAQASASAFESSSPTAGAPPIVTGVVSGNGFIT